MFTLIKNIAAGAKNFTLALATAFSGPSYKDEMEADLAGSTSLHDLEARQRAWATRR